jgi:mono/diheme cytochrome c family protein
MGFTKTGIAAAICLVIATSSHAMDVDRMGDVAHGKRLAENWCASCHQLSPGQPSTGKSVPAFAQIAQSSTFSSDHLAYLLYNPHPNMAKLALSRSAIDDIAAYVMSLKK